MGKETQQNIHMLQDESDIGEVRIADDVVAMIAGLAALEVDGVASLAGHAANDLLSRVGVKGAGKGARVEVLDRLVSVELAINIKYGYNIPAISKEIQEKVKNAIETMTGLETADVNIRIAGVTING